MTRAPRARRYSYEATTEDEISVQAGDVVELHHFDEGEEWWYVGSVDTAQGLVPARHLKPFVGSAHNQVLTTFA